MSRKDYVAIAAIVNAADFGPAVLTETPIVTAADRRLKVAQELSEYFAGTNPNFNRARFVAACFAYQQTGEHSH